MKKNYLIPLILILTLPAYSQDFVDHKILQSVYPGENAIYLKRKESVKLKLEKGAVKVYTDIYDDLLLLNDKGILYNERSVFYSHFEEIKNLQAKTLLPDGKSYKTFKVTDFRSKNDVSSGVFFDDQKALGWTFTNLAAGARTIVSYQEIQSEPRFFGLFFFGSYIDTREVEFTVNVPEGIHIKYKLFNVVEGSLEFSEIPSGKGKIYSWKAKNLKKYASEDGAPNIRYHAPHIVIYVDEYTVGKEKRKLLGTPDALYKWYASLTNDVNKIEDPALKLIVDSLLQGETDEFSKVKKIFYWVQDNIKYVAFEDGLGGFIPREAAVVCSRRFGDCKDMASIIKTMLGLAGIKSYLTWLGSRDIPYTYKDVPTPQTDNHMIATWISPKGEYYFLDATGKNAPIEMFTSMIQGKEALIGHTPDKCEVVQIPVKPKEINWSTDKLILEIEGTDIKGKGVYACSGYEKIRLGERMQNMIDEDKTKYLKGYLQKGNNKYKSDSLTYYNLVDRVEDLKMRYQFTLPDYLRQNGDEIYLNLNLDKGNKDAIMDPEKRKISYEFDFKTTERHVTQINVPDGYTVTFLPPDTQWENEDFGYTMKYEQRGNKVQCEKIIYINILLLEVSHFENWNKMIKSLSKSYTESIILKKK